MGDVSVEHTQTDLVLLQAADLLLAVRVYLLLKPAILG